MIQAMERVQVSPEHGRILRDLSHWNFMNDHSLVAPVYFESWWDAFSRLTWDEFDNQELPLTPPSTATTLSMALSDSTNRFFDRISTPAKENRNEIIRIAFFEAMDSLSAWQKRTGKDLIWQYYNGIRVTHLARLEPFSYKDLPAGGNKNIVNAARNTHGPSWRMIVELTTPVKAWGVYPGGQSGNPGSPYYADMLSTWVRGQYYELLFLKAGDDDNTKIMLKQNFKP
jgi:penicillin amidase